MHIQLCSPSYEKCDYSNQLSTNLQLFSKSKEEFQTMRNSGGQTVTRSPISAELDVRGLPAQYQECLYFVHGCIS